MQQIVLHGVNLDCAGLIQLQRLAWERWCFRVDKRREAAMRPLSVKARTHFVLVLLIFSEWYSSCN